MIGPMKTFILFLIVAVSMLAQSAPEPVKVEVPKPPDAAVAAFFKADGAVSVARAQHDAMMERHKKEVADSLARQIQLGINLVIAQSQLGQSCGEYQLDIKTIQEGGEARCIEKPKSAEPAKPPAEPAKP